MTPVMGLCCLLKASAGRGLYLRELYLTVLTCLSLTGLASKLRRGSSVKNPCTPEHLHELLRYEAETGKLFWKSRPVEMFVCKCAQHRWNMRYAGKEALNALMKNGYYKGSIFGVQMLAHRVIWALCKNVWPSYEIDHIDGNSLNNRIENLRDVTPEINRRNTARQCKTKAPYPGIIHNVKRGRFYSRITASNVTYHLGSFDNLDDAIAARKKAERELNFHVNHGRKRVRAA